MSNSTQNCLIDSLSAALHRLRSTPPRIIASPATQPRRAAVALIIRIVPSSSHRALTSLHVHPDSLSSFFALDWVNEPGATAEILFLRRETPPSSRSVVQNTPRNSEDAHVAFPGGRMEEGDEGGLYTAMRQTWEEIGIDLAEKDFMLIGQLDDREITTSLGKRLLMILSPFVFLQVSPATPPPDPAPGTHLYWIPISSLLASASPSSSSSMTDVSGNRKWTTVTVDISSRLAPKQSTILRLLVRLLLGSMQFNAILLDPNPSSSAIQTDSSEKLGIDTEKANFHNKKEILKLWGLSLGMTLDLISYMHPSTSSYSTDYPRDDVTGAGTNIAPSMTSVFPRFSYPDVNFWIWVFGKRYREVLRGWKTSTRAGGANDKRINWIGTAVNQFYAAVRKALIVVLVLRAIGIIVGLSLGAYWLFI